jgi:hypothetical protein
MCGGRPSSGRKGQTATVKFDELSDERNDVEARWHERVEQRPQPVSTRDASAACERAGREDARCKKRRPPTSARSPELVLARVSPRGQDDVEHDCRAAADRAPRARRRRDRGHPRAPRARRVGHAAAHRAGPSAPLCGPAPTLSFADPARRDGVRFRCRAALARS